MASGTPDYTVRIVDEAGAADMTVAVIGDQVVDLTGADDGDVLTVQPDGTVAPEAPASPPAVTVPVFKMRAADSSPKTDTTLATDATFTLSGVAAGQLYFVRAWLKYLGSTTGDIKVRMNAPGGSTGDFMNHRPAAGASNLASPAYESVLLGADMVGGAIGTGVGNKAPVQFSGHIAVGGSGDITLQWAQNSGDAVNGTVVLIGSVVEYMRIT